MKSIISGHPDTVLESLLAKGGRAHRRTNLAKIHDICRKLHATGSRNFTLSTIGRLVEAEGIIKGRTLYNFQSGDYRLLIEAWSTYAGPLEPVPAKTLASNEYLLRISDPAIRSIMQAIITERDKLKAQINIVKANARIIIDRRPLSTTISPYQEEKPVSVSALSVQLTPSEREALQKAVSAAYLEERGLREGSHGEIVNEYGRTIFEVGFARAIRKILESQA